MGPLAVRIRRARKEDLGAVLRLLESCDLPLEGVPESFDGFFLAQNEAGTLMGVVGLEGEGSLAMLRSLAVDPRFRNRGVGDQLVQHVLFYAKERGFQKVYLLTNTAESYFAAKGFRKIDREEIPQELALKSALTRVCPRTSSVMAFEILDLVE